MFLTNCHCGCMIFSSFRREGVGGLFARFFRKSWFSAPIPPFNKTTTTTTTTIIIIIIIIITIMIMFFYGLPCITIIQLIVRTMAIFFFICFWSFYFFCFRKKAIFRFGRHRDCGLFEVRKEVTTTGWLLRWDVSWVEVFPPISSNLFIDTLLQEINTP